MRVRAYKGGWMADAGINPVSGKRERRTFAVKMEAETWLNAHRQARLREGTETLTVEQRLDAIRAMQILAGRATLTEAARSYQTHTVTYPKASDAHSAYLAAKIGLSRRASTVEEIRNKGRVMIGAVGDRPLDQYATQDLEGWLAKYTPVTRNQYLTVIRGFFSWCVKRGMAPANPALVIEKASVELPPPHIHTPDEVRAVLDNALSIRPSMLGWYVLGYWCGIRIEEMSCVTWADIHPEQRAVYVSPEVAKKRRQRWVTLPDCALPWLALAGTNVGTIHFSRAYHAKIVAAAKVRWSRNVMRHSYGSYHLALTGNASETAMLMGHTDTKVVYDHYRNPVVRGQARDYFAILPHGARQTEPVAQAGK